MNEEERFSRCLAAVLRHEGGYADDPRDGGGPTNLGVTQATLSAVLGRRASIAELKALTPEAAAPIYRARYWRAVSCGRLPSGLDYLMFDTAVNMGPGAAARLLQATLDVAEDGVIGPVTLAAVEAANRAQLILSVGARRATRYRGLAGFTVFGDGWLKRLDEVCDQALAWAGEAVAA